MGVGTKRSCIRTKREQNVLDIGCDRFYSEDEYSDMELYNSVLIIRGKRVYTLLLFLPFIMKFFLYLNCTKVYELR